MGPPLLVVACLVALAVAHNNDVNGVCSADATAEAPEWLSRLQPHAQDLQVHAQEKHEEKPPDSFDVFAGSFNAGNLEFDANREDWKGALGKLLNPTHFRSDLVLLGIQELQDDRASLGEYVKSLFEPDRQLEAQAYRSGTLCGLVNHYDTVLYAFVKSGSPWSIKAAPYSSSQCKSTGQSGCNMNNNELMECGKVVNLIVFDISHAALGTPTRLCALNTHMSFSGEPGKRAQQLANAMQETEKAKCSMTVFVGDFNSRLHCGGGPEDKEPFIKSIGGVQPTLDKFCKAGKECSLDASPYDEMTQFLSKNNTVKCWESKKSFGSKSWSQVSFVNPLAGSGLREVEQPRFPPTYKLARCGDKEAGAKAENFCYKTWSGRSKHLAAWTDRILAKARGTMQTLLYDAYPLGLQSDHAAVVAAVRFLPDWK